MSVKHQLFERYAAGAKRVGAETGAITVLVSHRFSTVRMADLIIVVDGGRVTEVGDHDQLMARGGLSRPVHAPGGRLPVSRAGTGRAYVVAGPGSTEA